MEGILKSFFFLIACLYQAATQVGRHGGASDL
jgi:hypothetical protein